MKPNALKHILSLALCSLCAPFIAMAADLDVTPGSLSGLLENVAPGEPTLTLAGTADARDFACMRSLPAGVTSVDLSGLRISSFSSRLPEVFNRTTFEPDRLPGYTFFRSRLTAVALPAGLKVIENGSFAGSAITEITVPEGVEEIGDYAFYDCHSLRRVTLPPTVRRIGKGAFGRCPQLQAINLEETSLSEIPPSLFAGCTSLQSLQLPHSVSMIGREAFASTAISSLEVAQVEVLEPYALAGMRCLERVNLNSQGTYGEGVLMDNRLLTVLTGTPADIPAYFAANCSSLDPASQVAASQRIGRYSFANVASPMLMLGPNLTEIGDGAFRNLAGLTYIEAENLGSNIPAVTSTSFDGINRPAVRLHVSDDSIDLWRAHPEWGQFDISSNTDVSVNAIAADGITFRLENNMLTVACSAPLERLDIYSLAGHQLLTLTPQAPEVTVSIAAISDSVIIVSATADSGNIASSRKIMR